ncbi:sensor histidine kinase [Motiliproteus sediminis]|uniref:sensor histidine kinase n=1 Tax=Motiliproteus sediminis TaxID=1468178 RepID=UPI001AEF3AE0|nr:HAMP domain-containing sensor histidine kinase [Motiliproteus sediminis]
MLWQPRSILQLVLLGFITVVAPLSLAIVLTVQTLVEQAAANAALNERTVTLTRATQQLQSDLLDLERRTRQYATVQDVNLLRLVQSGFGDLLSTLSVIGERLDAESMVAAKQLRQQLMALQQELLQVERQPERLGPALQLFDPISRQMQATEQSSRAQVDRELAAQLKAADETRTTLLLTALTLAGLTLLVALFFSYWINRPIQQIERVIRLLGSGRSEGEIRIQGPRELQLLGRQLSWLRDHLVELDAQKQQFLRHISHELKTPLASLREGADLLDEGVVGPALNSAQAEIVSIIQQNSQELQRLIENLLDYNQLNRQQQVVIEPAHLAELVSDVVDGHRLALQRQNLQIEIDAGPESWCLDAARVRAALDNLVSNAVSYATPGTALRVRWYERKQVLYLEVANRGSPIAEDEAARIFEPFFQGQASRQGAIKGSGIGLSVARECIQAQGGALRLTSSKGYDVCFCITLPQLEETK